MPENNPIENRPPEPVRRPDFFAEHGIDLASICLPLQLTPSETRQFGEALLQQTEGWREIVSELNSHTHDRLKQPLKIIGHQGELQRELTTNAEHYADAHFVVGRKPEDASLSVFENIQCGYSLSDGFRRMVSLAYVAFDHSGKICEVGSRSAEALDFFKEHLLGRSADNNLISRIAEINHAVFDMLRADPSSNERLQEFARARGWPDGLAEKAGLAYFHENKTPILPWAMSQGFTPREMFDAGWCEVSIGLGGNVRYGANGSHVIRIPYYNDAGDLTVWRTRNLRIQAQDKHKYLSWPLNRAIEREFEIGEKLYYGWRLNEIKGRDIVITEGEFKCLVAWELSGVPTFGIPGITEVNRKMLSKIIAAEPASITVVLDRDPVGKGISRVDGITDSARAAFRIGKDIEELGFDRVRVGIIPDVKHGGKVGLDDLILATDRNAVQRIVSSATSVDRYAEKIGLDPVFAELLRRRQAVRKALEQHIVSNERGGKALEPERLESAVELLKTLTSGYRQYLQERFRGARRIDQVDREHGALFRVPMIGQEQYKLAMNSRGGLIPLERFRNDIALLPFVTSDVAGENRFCLGTDNRLPISMSTISAYFQGLCRDAEITNFFRLGVQALLPDQNPLNYTPASLQELTQLTLAGYLQGVFPADDYSYERGITLFGSNRDYWEQAVVLPLTISKKGGDVVAIASIPVFEDERNVKLALHQDQRLWSRLSMTIRQTEAWHHSRKLEEIGDVLLNYYGPRLLESTAETLAPLGIRRETCERERLIVFRPDTWRELLTHLGHKRLLTQAAENGLYNYTSSGDIVPRFHGDVVLMPIVGASGRIQNLRVLPLSMIDQIPPVSPPDCKPVFSLYGAGRSQHQRFQSDRVLYLGHTLSSVKGEQLIITYNEWDALHIGQHREHVVGLNSSLHLHQRIVRSIREADPDKILIIIPPEARSKYDDFRFDGIPGAVKEVYDLQQQLENVVLDETAQKLPGNIRSNHIPEIHLVMPALAPTQISRYSPELMPEYVDHLCAQALPLKDFLASRNFNRQSHEIVQRFSRMWDRFLEYLEVPALRDPLDRRPIDWWVRHIERFHTSLDRFASSTYHQSIRSLDSMIESAVHSSEPLSFREVVARRGAETPEYFRSRALYYPGNMRYSAPNISRLRETVAIRAQMLGPDSLPQFRALNLLGASQGDGAHRQIERNESSSAPRDGSAQSASSQNAISSLYEFAQANPGRVKNISFVFGTEESLHRCTAHVTVDKNPVSAEGLAKRKQDAKIQAAENLLVKLTGLLGELPSRGLSPTPAPLPPLADESNASPAADAEQIAHETETIAQGYPNRLQEYADKRKLPHPRYHFSFQQRGGIGIHSCACELNFGDLRFRSEEQHSTLKKNAKHLAAAAAWRWLQLEDAQIAPHIPSGASSEAPTLMPSDGNFVGGLQIFCDRLKISKPQYEETTLTANSKYAARVQIHWNEQQLVTNWHHGESKASAKQLCAEALCKKLFSEITGQQLLEVPVSRLSTPEIAVIPEKASLLSPSSSNAAAINHIGAIGEYAQQRKLAMPVYKDGPSSGADHAKSFSCVVTFTDGQQILHQLTSSTAPTKKAAKADVAQKLYETLLKSGEIR